MFTIQEIEKLFEYQYNPQEAEVAKEVIKYVDEKYGVEVYKCVFRYDDNWYFEGDRTGEVTFISVFLKTTQDKKIVRAYDKISTIDYFPEDVKAIKKIMNAPNMPKYVERLRVGYDSFETHALEACYYESESAYRAVRESFFNPNTMAEINNRKMIVTYKTKELWEEAKASGETERLKRAYYEIIKPFDIYDYISLDKNLYAIFDYPEIKLSPRENYERFLDLTQGLGF